MAAATRVDVRALLHSLLRGLLLLAIPLVVALIALYWYARGGREMETENAYVKAHIVPISSALSGRAVTVAIHNNDQVAAGALLFQLDTSPYEVAVAKAKAQQEVVRTEVRSMRAEYRATLMEREETVQRIAFLTRQLERQQRLKEYGMIRADVYDEARLDLEVARRRVASIDERANRVLANLGGDPNLPEEQHPRFVEATAALSGAQLDLARTRIVAPVAGVISNLKLRVGEFVQQGTPVFSLIESGQVWVEANFKETQLTHMRVGQRARIVADAYPDQPWSAAVATIAPATGAEFAILPPQNATGNWVKVVQRVPVLLEVQQAQNQPPLRAGMTVTVSVDTGRERGLPKPVQALVDAGILPRALQPPEAHASEHR